MPGRPSGADKEKKKREGERTKDHQRGVDTRLALDHPVDFRYSRSH
jgi:hypothetical protein